MNALVVYHSKFGNTQRVADAIARVLSITGSTRLMVADEVAAEDFDGVDLFVMGVPTHAANVPERVRDILAELPAGVLRGVHVAAFDTSFKMNRFLLLFTAARRLSGRLRRLGGRQISPPINFFVTDTEGPLYEGEIERAERWAEALVITERHISSSQPAS